MIVIPHRYPYTMKQSLFWSSAALTMLKTTIDISLVNLMFPTFFFNYIASDNSLIDMIFNHYQTFYDGESMVFEKVNNKREVESNGHLFVVKT